MSPHPWNTRLTREKGRRVSPQTMTATGLSFWSEEPSKYNWPDESDHYQFDQYHRNLITTLSYARVRLSEASEQSFEMLINGILPVIIAKQHPHTLEFVNHHWWRMPNGDVGTLRGIIIRRKDGEVLLYAYGYGLESFHDKEVGEMLDLFGISKADQKRLHNCAWSKIDYSVMVQLP